jgi:hypothetical protein
LHDESIRRNILGLDESISVKFCYLKDSGNVLKYRNPRSAEHGHGVFLRPNRDNLGFQGQYTLRKHMEEVERRAEISLSDIILESEIGSDRTKRGAPKHSHSFETFKTKVDQSIQ